MKKKKQQQQQQQQQRFMKLGACESLQRYSYESIWRLAF